uniref:Agglutinin domain-containing protein n=1 Tax=Cucumis sativus TaxID=3659 RepID=A0A0A0KD65_CUCSA
MNLFKGLGKAGTDILGGAVKGAGKAVETVGNAAEKAPVVGGIGTVVEGTGKAIENVGKATENLGEKVFENKEKKPKKDLKDTILDQINEDYYGDDFHFDQGDSKESEKAPDDILKMLNDEMARERGEEDKADEIDEAEKELMKSDINDANYEEVEEDEESGKVIPKNFSLKCVRNNKYLRYISESENTDGLLRYSSKNIVGPYSKFAIRSSKTKPGFFHIRCCYNNKFWVRLSENSDYIAAIANEEEDDTSKWSSTLFEPIFVSEKPGLCYIRHVQLNAFLCIAEGAPFPYNDCLVARVEDISTIDENLALSAVMDWDSIFILPRYVAFKGNNDKYLEPSEKYLKFSGSSSEEPAVVFQIISMQDGYVRIKHVSSGKYWIRDPDWIWCDSIDINRDNPNTLFWPVKVDNNIVAFRNKGNNRFCKRLTTDGKTNCLNAAVGTITETARLEATEIVVARSIEDVDYRVNDARVYGNKTLTVSKGVAINNTKVVDKVSLKLRYEKKVERTWSSSVSSTFGVATRFNSKIPTVGSLKFELSLEVSGEKTREETEKEKSFVESGEEIKIPAMSKVKFSAVVKQACCDIPFSYTRRDTLKDGRQVTHRLDDGIFRGVTTYDYKIETEKVESL